uniref:Uncharacterized protein n=1 Tax=Arundo donax TaxID=35708 RepID=A0A0A9HQB9_ARUDO
MLDHDVILLHYSCMWKCALILENVEMCL